MPRRAQGGPKVVGVPPCLAHLLPWNPAPQAKEHCPDLRIQRVNTSDSGVSSMWGRSWSNLGPSTFVTRYPLSRAAGWRAPGLQDIGTALAAVAQLVGSCPMHEQVAGSERLQVWFLVWAHARGPRLNP